MRTAMEIKKCTHKCVGSFVTKWRLGHSVQTNNGLFLPTWWIALRRSRVEPPQWQTWPADPKVPQGDWQRSWGTKECPYQTLESWVARTDVNRGTWKLPWSPGDSSRPTAFASHLFNRSRCESKTLVHSVILLLIPRKLVPGNKILGSFFRVRTLLFLII